MNRAEYRREQREKDKGEVIYKLTAKQIQGLKFQAVEEASGRVFVLMLGLPLMALRDKFGFGRKRLEKMLDAVLDLYDSFERDYFTLMTSKIRSMRKQGSESRKNGGITVLTMRVGNVYDFRYAKRQSSRVTGYTVRRMRLIRRYAYFALFVDRYGIRECFHYADLEGILAGRPVDTVVEA